MVNFDWKLHTYRLYAPMVAYLSGEREQTNCYIGNSRITTNFQHKVTLPIKTIIQSSGHGFSVLLNGKMYNATSQHSEGCFVKTFYSPFAYDIVYMLKTEKIVEVYGYPFFRDLVPYNGPSEEVWFDGTMVK